jgi:hypothetical protein
MELTAMNDVPRDELISALVDGELTDDERRQAEAYLADDPACRQLYEELLLVRAAVAGLTRYKLDRDMSRRVLRRAERKMLLGGAMLQPDDEGDSAFDDSAATAEAVWKRDWRTVLWPALAVAAALLLMFFSPSIWSPPADQRLADQGSIAQKAPATGQRPGTAQAKADPPTPSLKQGGEASVRVAPSATVDARAASSLEDKPAASQSSATSTLAAAPPSDHEFLVLTADVAPDSLRQSVFHELLTVNAITLADEATRRAPTRFGGPLATSSARTAIEEVNRQTADTGVVAYVITAQRELVETLIAALREHDETYTVVEQTSLKAGGDGASRPSAGGDAEQRPSDSGLQATARRFASRSEAEAAAREAVRATPSDAKAIAMLATVVVVLRSQAATSTDRKAAGDESPE